MPRYGCILLLLHYVALLYGLMIDIGIGSSESISIWPSWTSPAKNFERYIDFDLSLEEDLNICRSEEGLCFHPPLNIRPDAPNFASGISCFLKSAQCMLKEHISAIVDMFPDLLLEDWRKISELKFLVGLWIVIFSSLLLVLIVTFANIALELLCI